MQYQCRLLPLQGSLPASGASKAPCLILAHAERSIGLVVEAIVDVIEEEVALDGGGAPGVLGAAILNGETMDLLDALHYLRAAHPDIDQRAVRSARRALVIEEQPFFRDMIVPVLKAAAFETAVASSLEHALAHQPEIFDVIVADPAILGLQGAAGPSRISGLRAAGAPLIAWCDDFDALRRADWPALGYAGAVSKFDRQRLMSLLAELATPVREAA
jgi:two-component system chemotaxis sensor kinase CheA